jgi:GTP diphosphokinase / guanosine-3',5'-bis(diphosphate) 3'-diphosphatase
LSFNELKHTAAQYLDPDSIQKIEAAYQLAAKAHHDQKRFTGEPYITHPVAVAQILANMRMDPESIMAALLHDVIEDTAVTKEDLINAFGVNVATLVDGVSKLARISFEDSQVAQAENFRKMLLAMVQDLRVIIIKLADRLHNMRTITSLPVQKKRRIAHETLEIYAPIANRLGMHHFYIELEDLCFSALNPMRHYLLKKAVHKAHGHRKEIIHTIEEAITQTLTEGKVLDFALESRQKHLYSIYKKMRKKHLSFNDMMDIYAVRIIVPTIDECYRTLGLVHRLYKPVPGRFKDYIAIPKANSYQSLHTTLFGPYGMPVEVQIRTQQMHKIAESGIAAHWLYKTPDGSFDKVQARTRTWLLNLLELQQVTGSSLEFLENVKIDLFPDEVYVFTPKGDIMELPAKSTALDFAYAVHTAIGNHCVAARINRHLAPLSTPLLNGQTVEIIIDENTQPNPAWLNFVKSGKARSSIRSFLKDQKQSEMIALGQRLLQLALENMSIEKLSLTKMMQTFLNSANLSSEQDLYESIGRGERDSFLVAQQLVQTPIQTKNQALSIKGTEGVSIKFAKCCWPIPGDPILGVLLPEEGLVIHTQTCKALAKIRARVQTVRVEWAIDPSGEYEARLDIELKNKRGALAELSSAIASTGADIVRIQSDHIDHHYAGITFILAVTDRDHLAQIMRNLRRIKAILKINRVH